MTCRRESPVAGNHEKGSGAGRRGMAERVGFEPTVPLRGRPLSRRVHSATLAPLHWHSVFKSEGEAEALLLAPTKSGASLQGGSGIFNLFYRARSTVRSWGSLQAGSMNG